jgi:NAD dependent epimerase/dehydratase family enzyme
MFVLKGKSVGLIHLVSNNSSMKELTQTIALKEHSKIILPNIPSFVIRLIFGEMGVLLTESLRIDYSKLTQSMYKTRFNQLSDLINEKEN